VRSPYESAYIEALTVVGARFPKPMPEQEHLYDATFARMAEHDVPLWSFAIFSGKPAAAPPAVTDVFIQEAVDFLGRKQPRPIPILPEPSFVAKAARRRHVVQKGTRFAVFCYVTVLKQALKHCARSLHRPLNRRRGGPRPQS
jgi:hypothetical protein